MDVGHVAPGKLISFVTVEWNSITKAVSPGYQRSCTLFLSVLDEEMEILISL